MIVGLLLLFCLNDLSQEFSPGPDPHAYTLYERACLVRLSNVHGLIFSLWQREHVHYNRRCPDVRVPGSPSRCHNFSKRAHDLSVYCDPFLLDYKEKVLFTVGNVRDFILQQKLAL